MRVGDYELQEELGRGGMGVVFRARARDGREVALKVLKSAVPEAARARFERERRLLGEVEGEGFVPLLDSGDTPQGAFFVMPVVGGGSLRDRLRKGPLPVEETVALAEALAKALARAHAKGIVHRDLKPENILFTADGKPLVADLGLSKHFQLGDRSQSVELTRSDAIMGTAGYMAPEQIEDARRAGPRSDVFSLGAIIYECLAGWPAFEGRTFLELCEKVLKERPGPVANVRPETPPWLASVVERALARDPDARYSDAAALLAAIRARVTELRRPRWRVAVVATLALALAVVLVLVAFQRHVSVAVANELSSRTVAAKGALDAHREDDAIAAFEGAPRALEARGLSPEGAHRAVESSELVSLASVAYARRALSRDLDETALALADIDRARALSGLARGRSVPSMDELSVDRASIELRAGDVDGALSDLGEIPGVEAARLRFEAALAKGDASLVRSRLEAFERASGSRFEKTLAALEAAPILATPVARTRQLASDLESEAEQGGAEDRVRAALALGVLVLDQASDASLERPPELERAKAHFEAALEAKGDAGTRALRTRARTLLARVERRRGDLGASIAAATAALSEARHPTERALASLELARTSFASGDRKAAEEALAKAPRAARLPSIARFSRMLALESRRARERSFSGAEAMLDGPTAVGYRATLVPSQSDAPGDTSRAERALAVGLDAMDVVYAAREAAFVRRLGEPREWLDVDARSAAALARAREVGLADWLAGEIAENDRTLKSGLDQARERTRFYAERALRAARIALEEDPERTRAHSLALEARLEGASASSDEVRALVERTLRISREPFARAVSARALDEILHEPARAEPLLTTLSGEDLEYLPWIHELRLRARVGLDRVDKATDLGPALARAGPHDLALLRPFVALYSRSDAAPVVSFVFGLRLGNAATEALRREGEARLRARQLVDALEGEPELEWGSGRAQILAHGAGGVDAMTKLIELPSLGDRAKAQLLWLRGKERCRALARARDGPPDAGGLDGIVDLAAAVTKLDDLALPFLQEIDRIDLGVRLLDAHLEHVERALPKAVTSTETAVLVARVGLAAARARRRSLGKAERELALTLLKKLEANQLSVVGLLARAQLLEDDLDAREACTRAAIAIIPELAQDDSGFVSRPK